MKNPLLFNLPFVEAMRLSRDYIGTIKVIKLFHSGSLSISLRLVPPNLHVVSLAKDCPPTLIGFDMSRACTWLLAEQA